MMICSIDGRAIVGKAVVLVEELGEDGEAQPAPWPDNHGVTVDSEGRERRYINMHPNDFVGVYEAVFLKEEDSIAFVLLMGQVSDFEAEEATR